MSSKQKIVSVAVVAIVAIAVAFALGMFSSAGTVYLNAANAQVQLKAALNQQNQNITVTAVKCPKIVKKAGLTVTCTASAADGSTAPLRVTETASTALTVAPGQYLASQGTIEARLVKEVQVQSKARIVSVSCPQLIPVNSGSSFRCTLTAQPARPATIVNTFTNAQGAFHYQVIYAQ